MHPHEEHDERHCSRRTFLQRAALATLAAGLPGPTLEPLPDGPVPEDWFAFRRPEPGAASGSVLDASAWLDAPAGSHGFVKRDGDRLCFEDGTRVQFWGTGIAAGHPYVGEQKAERWARYLATYGANAVRFHKFTRPAISGNVSTRLDEEKWAQLDYFQARLRERGVYYGWSPIYGHRPRPGDAERLRAYDEIAAIEVPWSHLSGSTSGLVNFAEGVQDLHIDLVTHMLEHRNPHTGLRYADDPALAFVELQNEDNLFWGAIEKVLPQAPTYRRLLKKQFSNWLTEKYGSQRELVAAWGEEHVPDGAHLEKDNFYPKPNHGYFSYEYEQAREADRPMPRHVMDRMQFLYERQSSFYERFSEAIRETGYEGPIVSTNWQAGSGPSHYLNLHSDYRTGLIDRHNYFGGGTGHTLEAPGEVNNAAMVSAPGSGLLSTGMQQVENRPFALSEWISKAPNEWTAEAAPLVAAYGMGLQGWDASYSFANNNPHLTETVGQRNHNVYNTDVPTHMGLYPVLARMIYRRDVEEGDVISERNVNLEQLSEGILGFSETVEQDYDVKAFGGVVPQEALAAGRVVVDFTDAPEETTAPDLSPFWNRERHVIQSNTEQLTWHYAPGDEATDDASQRASFVRIDTPGTKGVVGFASGTRHRLGAVELDIDTSFAVVFVTSLSREAPVTEADRLLVTTVARARNTGMTYSDDGTRLLKIGEAPLLLEPVRLTLSVDRPGAPTVRVLDHAGRRTGRTVAPRADGTVRLDGAEHETLYYELVY